jgi:hypothetical protein
MTTRITAHGPSSNVNLGPTAARTTAPPVRPFDQVMKASASAIVDGAESAVVRLPGGAILAAAMRTPPDAGGSVSSPVGPSSAHPALTGVGTGAPAAVTPGGAPSLEHVLHQNADQNLYFLGLQERISQENREFTAVSNVLKARHETVKNAIGNLR